MPFVLKNERGEYLKGRNKWNMEMTPDLSKARVYATKGNATLSKNQQPKYGGKPRWGDLTVTEVRIVEVPRWEIWN